MSAIANQPKASLVDVAMLIDSRREDASGGARYDVIDPATLRRVGTAPRGTARDAMRALASARAALEPWRQLPVEDRAARIAPGLDAVEARKGALATLLTREQGKPLDEAMAEIDGFLTKMRSYLRLGVASGDGDVPRLPSWRGNAFGTFAAAAHGVTVGLVAWNFPVALMAKKIGPAMIGGGTIVLKPASTTPLTTATIVGVMNDAGLPPGVLNCVTGRGDEIGAALASADGVDRVHVTGSDRTGREIAERVGADSSTRLQLELAGSDPMIVCADADLDRAVTAAIAGRFRNAGQACTAVKRLYVAAEIYEDLVDALVARVRLREPGDGLVPAAAPRVRMGPVHTAAGLACLEAQLADAVAHGATVIAGGARPRGLDDAIAGGYFFEPTLVTNVAADSRLVTEEVFGPVLPIFRTSDLTEAIACANASAWDLNASIWSRDITRARQAGAHVRCRQLWINRLPFGI